MTDNVASINRTESIVLLCDGGSVDITHWFDCFGDECEPDDAISCVAGPDPAGLWYSIDLSFFNPVTIH